MALGNRLGIIRFCETPKAKGRIMNRLGLNDVTTESYLTILMAQSMLVQNNGKYVVTQKGKDTFLPAPEPKKSNPNFLLNQNSAPALGNSVDT
jgi:Winged helix-turn-helix